jgi:hypothetical protein
MLMSSLRRTLLNIAPLLLLLLLSGLLHVHASLSKSMKGTVLTDTPKITAAATVVELPSSNDSSSSSSSSKAAQSVPGVVKAPLSVTNESFSACLLVMDENFRLHEWISYHYHVLPLRYLVVAVDPRSQLSPEPIFDDFRQHLNMTIVSWSDTDFIPDWAPANSKEIRKRHLSRQRHFLATCLGHLHQHDRTWAALWDTDEYIAYNGFESPRTNIALNRTAKAAKDMSEPGTILRYLKDYGEDKCVTMPRVLVGNKETPGLLNESFPFDPRRFDTLRFRFRGKIGLKAHGFGKSLLNVQQIPSFPVLVRNPHRPVFEICPAVIGKELKNSPFYLNHFMGTWEAYSYRDDSRRGQEKSYAAYLERAQQNRFYENKMSPWMPAFLASVGEERGTIMLKEAGLDPEYNASFKISAWS